MVQIDEQDRHLSLVALGIEQRLVETIHQKGAVGQAGQPIVIGLVFELRLVAFALGNVPDCGGNNEPFGSFQRTQADLHRKFAAILAARVEFSALSKTSNFWVPDIRFAVFLVMDKTGWNK